MRVLIVEDELPKYNKVCTIVKLALGKHCEFTRAVCMSDGFEQAKAASFDLVVLDMGLPMYRDGTMFQSMGGLEVLEALRGNGLPPVIVAVESELTRTQLKKETERYENIVGLAAGSEWKVDLLRGLKTFVEMTPASALSACS